MSWQHLLSLICIDFSIFTLVPDYWLAVKRKWKWNKNLSVSNSLFSLSLIWSLLLLVPAISCTCAGFNVLCDCSRFNSLTWPTPAPQPPLFFPFCKVRLYFFFFAILMRWIGLSCNQINTSTYPKQPVGLWRGADGSKKQASPLRKRKLFSSGHAAKQYPQIWATEWLNQGPIETFSKAYRHK